MVSYGPWVQDVDFDQFWTIDTVDTDNYTQQIVRVDFETPFQNPAYAITEEDLQNAYRAAQLELGYKGAWIDWVSSGYDLVFPDWRSEWTSQIWARSFNLAGREFIYSPPNYGTLPPEGAIGIDYANLPYDPADPSPWLTTTAEAVGIQVGADSELEGKFEDNRVPNGAPLPWSNESRLKLTTAGVGEVDLGTYQSWPTHTAPNWKVRTLGAPVDLTPYGALDPDWTATLHTETSVEPLLATTGDPTPFNDTFTRWGWMLLKVRMEATVRPPLYRWVFPSDPYRRIFPRDDSLAGGAGRNYPPSRAVQTGNRTSGGYL